MTARGARDLLDSGEISSFELTQSFLDRIDAIEPSIKAFVTVTSEVALEQARVADERIAAGNAAPLTGLPMQLKDNMATKGVATTCSSRILEGFVPPYDATVATKLYERGGRPCWEGKPRRVCHGIVDRELRVLSHSEPLGYGTCARWQQRGTGGRGCGRPVRVRSRIRHGRKYSAACVAVWRRRSEADLRPRQQVWSRGVRQFFGPDRPNHQGRGRCRARPKRHRGSRRTRLDFHQPCSTRLYEGPHRRHRWASRRRAEGVLRRGDGTGC